MAWERLADRLDKLPLVLAGPILRRVLPESVTVWVALSQSATVKLSVYDSDDKHDIGSGVHASRKTTAIGKYLHLVAITAKADPKLAPGTVYFYDLEFSGDFGTKSLTDALGTLTLPISYPPLTLPSFALPPGLADLRLFHGSCRKPHAGGSDALALLDGLIAATAQSALDRPHQLLLTGDQIYADDVADALLLVLTEAGDTLLGWTETLPAVDTEGTHLAKDLPPYWRDQLLKDAGFTSGDRRSHLMSLGEWLAMYLFVWSDVLWPASLPKVDEIKDLAKAGDFFAKRAFLHNLKNIKTDTKNVVGFRASLPSVRRVLANVPSYMICDDHEITDDWNMTRKFCEGVYGHDLGVRMVQNGLVAFALCQAWGNAPEWFADDPQNPPGLQLLKMLDRPIPINGVYELATVPISTIVGVHTDKEMAKDSIYRVTHESGYYIEVDGVGLNDKSIHWNFTVEGPEHQVLVTDTRSWRTFPNAGEDTAPCLLPEDQIIEQIGSVTPHLHSRLQLAVVTTNMPPIDTIRMATAVLPYADHDAIYDHDLFDSWDLPSLWFDRMIVYLSGRLPQVNGTFTGPVVLLSGDVHFSFASRLAYWADSRLKAGGSANAVFAQLVSSALNNQSDSTIGVHNDGYAYAPPKLVADVDVAKVVALLASRDQGVGEGYAGWNWTSPNSLQVGTFPPSTWQEILDPVVLVEGGDPKYIDEDEPTIRLDDLYTEIVDGPPTLTEKPDWHYRLDYLTATTGEYPAPPAIDPVPAGASADDRKRAAKAYYAAMSVYRDYFNASGQARDAVGLNNIAEMTFTWDAKKFVHHTLHWVDPKKTDTQFTLYNVPLDPESPTDTKDTKAAYPLIKGKGE